MKKHWYLKANKTTTTQDNALYIKSKVDTDDGQRYYSLNDVVVYNSVFQEILLKL